MINVLIGRGMCGFGVHSVSVWESREADKCAQDGVCRRCDAKREQTKHEYPKRGGRVELHAAVVSSGRSPVRGLPIYFPEDPTAVEVTVVV